MPKNQHNNSAPNIFVWYVAGLLAIILTLGSGWLGYRAVHQHKMETKKEECIRYEAGAKQRLDGIVDKNSINRQVSDEVALCKAIYSE